MPTDTPVVQMDHIYGSGGTFPKEPEEIGATILECTKGAPFEPVLIAGEKDLLRQFKIVQPQFFRTGGKGFWGIRATAGTPVAAKDVLYDNATTPVNTMDVEAKQVGSYAIYISCSSDANGNTVIVEEDGFEVERYASVSTIEGLCDKINAESNIIDATFVAEGSGELATVARKQLGTGVGNTAGTDGTVDSGATDGTLAAGDAPTAHETALAKFETIEDNAPGVIFTTRSLVTVLAKYATHVVEMSKPLRAKWRLGVFGAASDATVAQRVTQARDFNEEEIILVGHSLYDRDGVFYTPAELAPAVAGKLCGTPYSEAVWGGSQDKVLGINGNSFFTEIGETLDDGEVTALNSAGVITFKKNRYGISIREGVTTAQTDKSETDTDSIFEVRVVQHACRELQKAAEEMTGEKITDTFESDLKKTCSSPLDIMMSQDGVLVADEENGLDPYEVEVAAIPRANAKLGRADIDFQMTVAGIARRLFGRVVVR